MSAIIQSMKRAIEHHRAGRLAQAEALYRTVLQVTPDYPDALHLVGVVAHQQGRHDEGSQRIGEAIAHNSEVAEYHNNLGAAEQAAGRIEAAEAAFAQALQVDPGHDSAWSNLVAVRTRLGDTDGTRAALQGWTQHCPDSARAHSQLGAQRYLDGDIQGAIEDHDRAAQLAPEDPKPRLHLAILCHENGDDAAALSAFEDARRRHFLTGDLGAATVQSKLDHDIGQIRWLVASGEVPADWSDIAARYQQARLTLYGEDDGPLQGRTLSEAVWARIGRWYNRPIHVVDCPARPDSALSPDLDGASAEARYRASSPGVTWADDLLRPEALDDLRRFVLGSTIWTDFRYTGGYVGTALANGFANGLLLQIARELRERLPGVIGPHPLRQMWAYKYDQRLTGIGPHADSAAINVNFWITADSANQQPETGGLVVWRKCAPLEWDFDAFNRQPDKLLSWARDHGAEELHVPYRCNRAVIFDSNLIHRTADLDFAPGYENRRVNITMLFGTRGATP